jgi:hypothetical protein
VNDSRDSAVATSIDIAEFREKRGACGAQVLAEFIIPDVGFVIDFADAKLEGVRVPARRR